MGDEKPRGRSSTSTPTSIPSRRCHSPAGCPRCPSSKPGYRNLRELAESLDESAWTVFETKAKQGNPQSYTRVPNPGACTPSGFYIDADEVVLCPQACALLQTDKDAKIEVSFTCEPLNPG